MARWVFTIFLTTSQYIGPTSLLRDVDAGHMGYTGGFQYLAGSGVACVVSNCAGHFWRSLWRDLRVSPRGDFALLSLGFGLLEPEERNSSNFFWSNSTMSDSTVDSRNLMSACAIIFSLAEKTVPNGVNIFYFLRKLSV